jgi:tRNA-dihydrouridine synthase B
MFKIGNWAIHNPTILAPMAGVTDLPFRQLCKKLGAGLVVSEMVTADTSLWNTRKSIQRLAHSDDEPRSIQLAGNDPIVMATAARANVTLGAQIIDINMGCPAKKVCKKAAGSALLQDEKLVKQILTSVVQAVDVPVTLKIRTGWDLDNRNAVTIAKIAEDAGIQALAVHGRTRACAFKGEAEYNTIALIVDVVNIPVFANGDITSPEKAQKVLELTGANAVMIGRAAQGNPWLFREINHFLATGEKLAEPTLNEVEIVLNTHIRSLHDFYGELMGARIARKHVAWYLQTQEKLASDQHRQKTTINSDYHKAFRRTFNNIESAQEQYDVLASYFEILATIEDKAA